MTARIIPFPGKHRVVTAFDQVFDDLDSFGRLMRTGKLDSIGAVESLDSFADDLPCDVEPTVNNLRPDGTEIVHTGVLETRGKDV